ncbi:MAG: DCC1-like thiol-disulfide oxidoreductase family protein [Myxococcaceae bacterium]
MFLKQILGSENGWTGGQYSLVRFVFGTYLAFHFAQLAPYAAEVFSSAGVLPSSASPLFNLFPGVFWISDAPGFVIAVLIVATLLSLCFAAGLRDRCVAVILWWIWASLFVRNPLISNPGLPYVGWMLLAHAFLPQRPHGSWGWRFPQPLHLAAWFVLAAGYSYSGYTKLVSQSWIDGTAFTWVLESPLARGGSAGELLLSLPQPIHTLLTWGALGLEILFLPFALIARLRPLLWGCLLSMHFGLIALIDFADLSLGMVMIHLFTFDPAWVPGLRRGTVETLFYDGNCGLCHRAVRLVLSEDPRGEAFRFAPLHGESFNSQISEEQRASLPDSLVVRTSDGTLLTRSDAVLHLMKRLGGIWRLLAILGNAIPRGLRDRIYDGIAAVRQRLFAKPRDACPVVPKTLRVRFDA